MATIEAAFEEQVGYDEFNDTFGDLLDEIQIVFGEDSDLVTKTTKSGTTTKVDDAVFLDLKGKYTALKTEEVFILAGDQKTNLVANKLANTVQGNDADNAISGGDGNDTIKGGGGKDTITGGKDNDVLWGEEGNDSIKGDAGDDKLVGGQGNDFLDGGVGSDDIDGGAGKDTLVGGDGDDSLTGGGGNDKLNGGKGNDTIYDDNGNDYMEGGAGNDSFVIGNDSGFDIISDFKFTTKTSKGITTVTEEDKLYIMDKLGGGASHTGDDSTFGEGDFTLSMAADDSGIIIAFADGGTVLLKGLKEAQMSDLTLDEDDNGVYFTLN